MASAAGGDRAHAKRPTRGPSRSKGMPTRSYSSFAQLAPSPSPTRARLPPVVEAVPVDVPACADQDGAAPSRGIQFASLLLTALSSGVVLAHVLDRPGKARLNGPTYRSVQSELCRGWQKAAGGLETGVLL